MSDDQNKANDGDPQPPSIQDIKINELENTVAEQNETINALSQKIETLESASPKAKSNTSFEKVGVDINGKLKTFKFPKFRFGGKDLKAVDVAKDKNLCAKILKQSPNLFE